MDVFFFQAEDGIRDLTVTGVQTCALPIFIEKIAARVGASKIIRNFLFVLADHRRTNLIPEVIAAFHEVIRQRQGIAEAEISSAIELSAAQKKEMAATLAGLTGKEN